MTAETRAQSGPRLVGLGELAAREHPLGALDVSVGADRENDLVIAHPTVSRRHAVLGYHAGGYTIADLQSTNGTFVNGRRVRQPAPLRPGDEVAFGAAKFTMVSGTAAVGVPLKARSSEHRKLAAAAAGIIALALVGFIVTRYALSFGHRGAVPATPASPLPATGAAEVAGVETPPTPEPPPEATAAETYSPLWLRHLNDFRASAGLAPVESDSRLSDGDRKHATYIMKNFISQMLTGELGAEAHTEEPSRPFFTPEGAEAARTSDVAERGGKGPVPDPQGWAITGWIVAPFHRLFILSPLLRDVGFGADCDEHNCVALLNVLSGSDPLPRYPRPMAHPIFYPPDGGSIPADMGELGTEWPTPISGCDGYAFPVGIPLTVQLGPAVDAELDSFSFSRDDGAQLPACGFDANSYRNPGEDERRRVVSNLRGQGAIVIVPRAPLQPGARYDALVTINGTDYKWSFEVAAKASSGQTEGGNR